MRWKLAQWFEIRWWKRYLVDKRPESYLAWKSEYWSAFLEQTDIQLKSGMSVLDAGCGPAGIFTVLENQHVTAIDPLLSSYATLPHFSTERYPWVRFEQMKVEHIPSTPSFDLVFCLNVINHVQDIDKAYDALIAALGEESTLVLSIDCHNFLLPKLLFRSLPLDILHPHQYGLKEYETTLLARGLSIQKRIRLKSGILFDYYVIVAQKNHA